MSSEQPEKKEADTKAEETTGGSRQRRGAKMCYQCGQVSYIETISTNNSFFSSLIRKDLCYLQVSGCNCLNSDKSKSVLLTSFSLVNVARRLVTLQETVRTHGLREKNEL